MKFFRDKQNSAINKFTIVAAVTYLDRIVVDAELPRHLPRLPSDPGNTFPAMFLFHNEMNRHNIISAIHRPNVQIVE